MYEKIKLDYNSLEPFVDDETLDLHYNKHYGKYLDNLNRLLKENNYKVVTVSKLFAINGKTLENTKSYRYAN